MFEIDRPGKPVYKTVYAGFCHGEPLCPDEPELGQDLS